MHNRSSSNGFLGPGNNSIVFNAEVDCYPMLKGWYRCSRIGRRVCHDQQVKADEAGGYEQTIFLNSGVYMGRVQDIKIAFRELNLLTKTLPHGCMEDQALFSYLYSQQEIHITLDFNSTLFGSMFKMQDMYDINNNTGYFFRRLDTGDVITPFILHFNGNKEFIPEFFTRYIRTFVGLHGRDVAIRALEQGHLRIDNEQVKFRDFCNVHQILGI